MPGYRRDFAVCRAYGHRWDFDNSIAWIPSNPVWKFKVILRCDRCGMVRKDALDAYGDVASRDYSRPEGYSWAGEDEKPTAKEFRLMVMERTR